MENKTWEKYGTEYVKNVRIESDRKELFNVVNPKMIGNKVEVVKKLANMNVGDSFIIQPQYVDRIKQIVKNKFPHYRISYLKDGAVIRVIRETNFSIRLSVDCISEFILKKFTTFYQRIKCINPLKLNTVIKKSFYKHLKIVNMKNLIRFFGSVIKNEKKDVEKVQIDSNMPMPVSGVDYREVLKIKKALDVISVGQSFCVEQELTYTVRRLANTYFPEYKITIRKTGESFRAFRVA